MSENVGDIWPKDRHYWKARKNPPISAGFVVSRQGFIPGL
jgi:hypothetical protein